MKIIIIRFGPLGAGGVRRVVESWARVLAGAGHQVIVLAGLGNEGQNLPGGPGIRTEFYPSDKGGNRFNRLARARRAGLSRLDELRRDERPDLIISHDSLLTAGMRGVAGRTPILQTFHSPLVDENRLNNWKYAASASRRVTYPLTWAMSWYQDRRALRAATGAQTLSNFTWGVLSARYPGPSARLPWQRIPGTYDDERFVLPPDRGAVRRRLGLEPEATLLLTVRRLVPRNGVDRLLDCAQLETHDGRPMRILVGGTGPLRDQLADEITRRGLGDRMRLLGFIAEDDLVAYYQASDAFLLPTRDLECFGLPLIEAMACGSVPLTVPIGGPAEICEELPACMAADNSDAAFTALVGKFVGGRIRVSPTDLADRARSRYSEGAIRPSVLSLVEGMGRE